MTENHVTPAAQKWFRYSIDYEYGTAELWSKVRLPDPIKTFRRLASECFGIRKSIGETRLLDEELLPLGETVTTPKSSSEQLRNAAVGDDRALGLLSLLLNREHRKDIPPEKLADASYILAHSGGDVIVFNEKEEKLVPEWDA